MEFKIGSTHYLRLGIGKPYKIHIVAIVDECYVVYKWYGRRKQWWHYEVEDAYFLGLRMKWEKL